MGTPRFNALGVLLAGLVSLFASSDAAAAGPQGETLVVAIPQDFQLGDQGQSGPGSDIAEYIPKGETVEVWSRMITVQAFHKLAGFDPDQFAQALRARMPASCPGAQGELVRHGQDRGYPYALWLFTCPLNPQTGKPETFYNKLISGGDALYSVQYSFRSTLNRDAVPSTLAFLDSVALCDPGVVGRPCPTVSPP